MPSSVSRRERRWMMVCFVLAGVILFGGRSLPEVSAREKSDGTLFQELKTFTDVLAIVQRDYVRDIPNKKLVEGAIKGLLTTLDPHSGYLDPDFYQDLQVQTKGEFGGLGIELTIKDGLLVVVSPMEGSPAEKAGVRAGDSIVKIEGQFTKEFSLVDAVKKLRGPRGTSINLSLQRKGAPDLIEVTVVRDNINVHSVRSRYLGDGFGYVRISQFMEKTTDDLKAALVRIAKESPDKRIHGLVLDMRNNPGGLLTQAIGVSDLFLRDGIIVYTEGRVESQKQKFFAHERGTEPDYPMVVIVNGGSASASEIVAGAMKDSARALILGTQTFGKGSVQTITPLDNGGAITLTTALYFTKSGRSIQATGIRPDIEMDAPKNEQVNEAPRVPSGPVREGDLPGAIKNPSGEEPQAATGLQKINQTPTLKGDYTSVNVEKDDLPSIFKRDPQLSRALELLKTFNIFGGFKGAPAKPAENAPVAQPAA